MSDTEAMQVAEPTEIGSVTEQVLKTFVEAVAAEAGFEEIAARLKTTLFEERDDSDIALRKAIFGSDDI